MNTFLTKSQHYLETVFTLDTRSLGVLRIGMGIVSINNLYIYYPSLEIFLGPLGIFTDKAKPSAGTMSSRPF